MRGKVKDAEAEALLKLLRQEKEFLSRIPTPQIQQRTPLPAIGSGLHQTTSSDRTDETFITQTRIESPLLSSNDKGLLSESSFLWTSRTDEHRNLSLTSRNEIGVPSAYSWKDQKNASDLALEQQQRKSNGRSLPPLQVSLSPYGELCERPSCPKPRSPKL